MGKIQRKKYRVHLPAAPLTKPSKLDANQDDSVAENINLSSNEKTIINEPVNKDQSKLSRGQRKRLKRREAIEKKLGMVQRSVLRLISEENGTLSNVKDLQTSLMSAMEEDQSKCHSKKEEYSSKMTSKQRKRLAVEELGHLKAVQNHPSFKSNPFAAIQLHLKNTIK